MEVQKQTATDGSYLQRLHDQVQLVGRLLEERIERVVLECTVHLFVLFGNSFGHASNHQLTVQFANSDHGDGDVGGQADRGAEVARQADQQAQRRHEVLGVNQFDRPPVVDSLIADLKRKTEEDAALSQRKDSPNSPPARG